MNAFIKIRSREENNCFLLTDLDGGPEEQWLLAEIEAASQENGKYPNFYYYIIDDSEFQDFYKFYKTDQKEKEQFRNYPKFKEWWHMIYD